MTTTTRTRHFLLVFTRRCVAALNGSETARLQVAQVYQRFDDLADDSTTFGILADLVGDCAYFTGAACNARDTYGDEDFELVAQARRRADNMRKRVSGMRYTLEAMQVGNGREALAVRPIIAG